MLFIPILKNRKVELRAIHNICDCLSSEIIPLFEVVRDVVEKDPLVDPVTGKVVYDPPLPGKKHRRKRMDDNSVRITTLDKINQCVCGKAAFIDFFRFKEEVYGRNSFDPVQVALSIQISRDENLYLSRLLEISKFPNFIPVLSIKTGFPLSPKSLQELIDQLQDKSSSIALRITEEFFDSFKPVIENQLRPNDYLLYDIGEQPPKSKFVELFELSQCDTNATKILVNSPRLRKIYNTKYETNGPTVLIDNSALALYAEYNLDGVGDYCGLKDTLPSTSRSGQGSALALLFEGRANQFWSYRNEDSKLGQAGFEKVKLMVLAAAENLDSNGDCLAFKRIRAMPGNGGWQTWIEIEILRYIHQIYKLQNP